MGPPYYPGHEAVGVVIAVGEDVREVSVGERVTVEPTLPCGGCKPCLTGVENLVMVGRLYPESGSKKRVPGAMQTPAAASNWPQNMEKKGLGTCS